MSDSITSMDEASRCPRCKNPGEETSRTKARSPRTRQMQTVITFTCRSERCVWFNTSWIVQVDEDGNIPLRKGKGEKQYPLLTPGQQTHARDEIRQLHSMGLADAEDLPEEIRNNLR